MRRGLCVNVRKLGVPARRGLYTRHVSRTNPQNHSSNRELRLTRLALVVKAGPMLMGLGPVLCLASCGAPAWAVTYVLPLAHGCHPPLPQGLPHLPLVSPPRRGDFIPTLTCQLHQGLLAHGEHLIRRCQGWTEDHEGQRGLCLEFG